MVVVDLAIRAIRSSDEIALDEGYNVIKVHSYRDAGINYILYNNFDKILQPQIVTPIGVNICWIKDIMRDMRGKER